MSSQGLEALYATGHWLLTNTRHADAAKVFRVMVLSNPEDERGWLALGACHEAVGQRRLAIELYRIAADAASPAVRCTIARGKALRALDCDDEATEAFDAAYELAMGAGEVELAGIALREKAAS